MNEARIPLPAAAPPSAAAAPPRRAPGPSRTVRSAGYLAILFGVIGAFSGLAGAGTFVPYATASTYDPGVAGWLTVIAVAGAGISVVSLVAGWGILRARDWAPSAAIYSAVGGIAVNWCMTAPWPSYSAFAGLVTVAFGLELLLLGIGTYGWLRPGRNPSPTAPASR